MTQGNFEHEYPPGDWTSEEIAEELRAHPAVFPLPTYDDTGIWSKFSTTKCTAPVVESVLERAEAEKGSTIPSLPASLYLDYTRTGNRSRYEDVRGKRTRRLSAFALAECFERDGEYLDEILDYAWTICEQTTWVLPAHLNKNARQERDGLPGVVPDADRYIGLRPARIAQLLAEIDYILGEQLHPALRERIRSEVDRRILTPYEARDDFKWLSPPTSNWNAVCNTGVGIAALHLIEDVERLSNIIAKVVRSLEYYLADFDHDGCTAEGINYWNYGFRSYVQFATHLEARTSGVYSLLSPPIVQKIAQYPLRVEMSPGHFLPFSDANEAAHVDPFIACVLGRRFDRPGLAARGRQEYETGTDPGWISNTVRAMQEVIRVPSDWKVPSPPDRVHFTGHDWWISRSRSDSSAEVVVAAKGGHNDEAHNHNDLGSFVFHCRGESLLTDLGSPVYDAEYFDDGRYEYLVTRSLGHNVPLVNGFEQPAGKEFAATVLERVDSEGADSFSLDLTDAYLDEAGLSSLNRMCTLDRAANRIVIEDEATFEHDDNEFVEVLVSYFPMEIDSNRIVISGENGQAAVTADPSPVSIDVERLENAVRGDDVWRTRLSFRADERIGVSLEVALE